MEDMTDPIVNAEKKQRARKSNFSPEEIAILVDEGVQHHSLLSAAFGPGVTKKCKDSMWEKIASKLSANTAGVRSAGEVRKKWNDIRCQVKKRAQLMRKEAIRTGGGPFTFTLSELDEKVLSTIPICQVEGIDGGMETPLCTEDQPSSVAVQKNSGEATLPQESAAAQGSLEFITAANTSTSSVASADIPQKIASDMATSTSASTVTPRSGSTSHVEALVKMEASKLEVLQQLLTVETQRLSVERERLSVERERLILDRQRLQLKESILNSSAENFITPVINFD